MRSTRILTVILAFGLAAAPAAAQTTPPTACASDSLYLISPDLLNLDLQERGRLGMVVSWPNLDLNEATCYSLKDLEGLAFTPVVTGGFGDRVDRILGFSTADSGQVGNSSSRTLQIAWRSEGATTYGNLAGIVNLANNGGLQRWDESAGAWIKLNAGLPMYWRQTNIVALGQGTGGVYYAGFTAGQTIEADPRGLYRFDGSTWARVGESTFDGSRRVTEIAVDPTDNNRVAVGSALGGLFISSDGGQTFVNWGANLDPTFAPMPESFRVTALTWAGGRLYVGVANLGVFVSADAGASFTRLPLWVPDNLDRANPLTILPLVNRFTVDPGNPNRVLAALYYHGVYESTDAGANWHDLYGDLVVPDPEVDGAWVHTAQSVAIDPADPQVLLMGVLQRGIYRTADGGSTWTKVAQEPDLQPANTGQLTRIIVTSVPGAPGRFYALEDKWKMLESSDGGLSWQASDAQPTVTSAQHVEAASDGSGDLLVGTWAGGIYVPGTALPLAKTYTTATSPELQALDLGLSITFDAGYVNAGDAFKLVCQTFQGWAVWRSPWAEPDRMTLVGLYDRVNPETCIEGYCGDVNYDPIPQCFAAKRAGCFDLSNPDTIRFFDDEIYNGFSYYYSVASFDYGNTAQTTPENNNKSMIFSPRWDGDERSPFNGGGNRAYVQVNLSSEPAAEGDVIYVYPNPLRLNSGIPGEDGRTVIFTNLPAGSRVRVFTTAGDDVANLGPELQVGGQIRWGTENKESEPVAAGVYLYKVEMPTRDDFWGKLAIIR